VFKDWIRVSFPRHAVSIGLLYFIELPYYIIIPSKLAI